MSTMLETASKKAVTARRNAPTPACQEGRRCLASVLYTVFRSDLKSVHAPTPKMMRHMRKCVT